MELIKSEEALKEFHDFFSMFAFAMLMAGIERPKQVLPQVLQDRETKPAPLPPEWKSLKEFILKVLAPDIEAFVKVVNDTAEKVEGNVSRQEMLNLFARLLNSRYSEWWEAPTHESI